MLDNKIKNHLPYLSAIIWTGILSGISVIIFKYMIFYVKNLFFMGVIGGSYEAIIRYDSNKIGVMILFIPFIGSILVTFLVQTFTPEAKGHGLPQVIYAIRYKGSVINPLVAIVKSLASSISIGTGGSCGVEGSIVQITATLGSIQNLLFKELSESQRATLVACGASSGFAASFDSPLSGVIFSIELLLPLISVESILALMVSSSIAVVIANFTFHESPHFTITRIYKITSYIPSELPLYLLLGILVGIAAALFVCLLEGFEEKLDKMRGSPYLKHGISMLIVGIILYFTNIIFGSFYIEGAGHQYILMLFRGEMVGLYFLLSLFFLKMIVTILTLGSGGSGGIFAPSMLMGGFIGASFHAVIIDIYPNLEATQIDFILGGMVGMISGVTGVVLTAITMILETTHSFYATLPMVIIVFSTVLTRSIFVKDSMYHSVLNKKISSER